MLDHMKKVNIIVCLTKATCITVDIEEENLLNLEFNINIEDYK